MPDEIQNIMSNPVDAIHFDFVGHVEMLVRLLLCSPLASDEKNICLEHEAPVNYAGFCNGDRWKRIQDKLPQVSHALTCIIFLDEIHQDAKGFSSGEGAIIVSGNLRLQSRESGYAKMAFGTFPSVEFPQVYSFIQDYTKNCALSCFHSKLFVN